MINLLLKNLILFQQLRALHSLNSQGADLDKISLVSHKISGKETQLVIDIRKLIFMPVQFVFMTPVLQPRRAEPKKQERKHL